MPKIVVQIEWDTPDDQNWLNVYNVALALHAYCKNTQFEVNELQSLADVDDPIAGVWYIRSHKQLAAPVIDARIALSLERIAAALEKLVGDDDPINDDTWGD